MKLPVKFAAIFILLCATVVSVFAFRDKMQEKEDDQQQLTMPLKWQVPVLPKAMIFANEKVPLDRWEIREQLEREFLLNYYNIGNILYIMKLAHRYFPLIEERLKANGVPDDFKYLCVAESNLQNLVSRVGATGFWQFMPASATMYGLRVDDEIDERYHVLKSTDAACKYLKQAYAKLGSWTAAAASYNCGQGGYNNQATSQKDKDYYNLVLPDETNHYIFRILGFKLLLTNGAALGYALGRSEGYQPITYKTVKVTKSIPNLVDYALQQGINYKILRLYNPWLRSKSLTVKGNNEYVLYLPE